VFVAFIHFAAVSLLGGCGSQKKKKQRRKNKTGSRLAGCGWGMNPEEQGHDCVGIVGSEDFRRVLCLSPSRSRRAVGRCSLLFYVAGGFIRGISPPMRGWERRLLDPQREKKKNVCGLLP
jgi:hypothetical protein